VRAVTRNTSAEAVRLCIAGPATRWFYAWLRLALARRLGPLLP